ncbi:MAG: ATP-binding protein [Bacteroidales bacterium]|jgi:PAS domain S-box-containing protein|nr:ATP-binding protein [Bacteroidales bacterium]MDD3272724.1 ATP-binding protein [Bacteroidales bacterium]MDD4058110.1 ATP-binding protein [Bacteroidales bacterium]
MEKNNLADYLFEHNPQPMWIYDVNTLKFLKVNNTAIAKYGYSKDEFLKMTIKDIRPSDDVELLIKDVKETREKINITNKNWRHLLKSDEIIRVEINSHSLVYEGRDARLVVVRDITDLFNAREKEKKLISDLIEAKNRAEESDKIKTIFLATMSHELRTPLNAIIGFSDLISEDLTKEDIDSYATTINKSGRHLLSLIEELFDISLIESGQIKLNFEKVELADVLNEIFAIISREQKLMGRKSVKLSISSSMDTKRDNRIIVTDKKRLKQIFVNLLKNALKFTEKGIIEYGYRPITIDNKNFLQFFVKDSGIGIPENKLNIIFEEFHQEDAVQVKRFSGAGLGLSISKKLVENLGGNIWVESTLNQGSTFLFTLPLIKTDNDFINIKKGDSMDNISYDFSGKRLLLAEDDEPSYLLLKAILKRTSILISRAKSGREAVNIALSDDTISLVLMDINMPDMNGFEATKIIKKEKPHLPIIAQTAYSISGDREKILEAGCDDYLSKPISKTELFKIIEKYAKG